MRRFQSFLFERLAVGRFFVWIFEIEKKNKQTKDIRESSKRSVKIMMDQVITWLTQDPHSRKHTHGWKHPIAACLIHYLLSLSLIIIVHDAFVLPRFEEEIIPRPLGKISLCPTQAPYNLSALFSIGYTSLLLLIRLVGNPTGIHRRAVLYVFTWLCNSTLVLGASFGLIACRPRMATGFLIAVSVDQILWYVDIIGYVFNQLFSVQHKKKKSPDKMFPIGVFKYLLWPETQWSAKITCTHHVWTIPLILYGANGQLDFGSYLINITATFSHVALSRWLTPFWQPQHHDTVSKNTQQQQQHHCQKYLNVNLGMYVFLYFPF